MSISIKNGLARVKQLMNESKFREAVKLLNGFEDKKSLTLQDQYELYYLKSSLFLELGYMEKALKFVELAYKVSKQLKNKFLIVDALLNKRTILGKCDKQSEELKTIRKTEQILNTINQTSSTEFKERSATLMLEKSGYYFNVGELNRSLKYSAKGFKIAKEINNKRLMLRANKLLSFNYSLKGDLERSHEFIKNYLVFANELNDKQEIIGALNSLGIYFTDKGDYDQALNYLERCLSLCYELDSFKTIVVLYSLFEAYFHKNSFKKAQNCLNKMEQILNDHEKFQASNTFYQLASAMMLIKNPENINYLKAKEILKQIIDEKPFSELYYFSLIYLCDTCFSILCETNDLQTLDEIYPYITQLKNIAKAQNSFWLIVETLLLQAKLKLITFEFRNAQKLLSKALDVAGRYNLDRLVNRILNEQNELSKNFIKWEKLKASGENISERMDLARIDEQIEIMLQKRVYLKKFADQT
jgi:tetratricopeptide (TPR) repeat protein